VEFIPPSNVNGQRTPDLCAFSGYAKALCEVKTINISEIEASRRYTGGVGSIEDQLDIGFFNKIASDLAAADAQMNAYDASQSIKRIAYVIVNFDDSNHEYSGLYRVQIEQYIKLSNPAPGLDVVLNIKPPFYASMS
jgi:hypothetical protein